MGYAIRRCLIPLGFLLLLSEQALAVPPSLGLPIGCIPGNSCFIQNYFDDDPGPGHLDYACGLLTYDGHHGTDFRLRDLTAMRAKVAVLAAAPGVVVGTRNDEPDISVKKRGTAALKGMDAGNGVRIDHGDGWSTQYSHMLRGSVRVHAGQRVERGDVLGFVGLSGNTEFPHLDFSISKDGKYVDPFNPERAPCGTEPAMLWSAPVAQSLRYQATGLLISGFSASDPEREIAEDGGYPPADIRDEAGSITFWVEVFGARKNDQWSVVVYGPNLKQMAHQDKKIEGNKAVLFSSFGMLRGKAPWTKGPYSVLFRLMRDGKIIVEERRTVSVN